MSWISVRTRALNLILFSLWLYTLLVVADWMLLKVLTSRDAGANLAAQEIEQERSSSEDAAYIKQAVASGYSKLLYPELFESGRLLELVRKHGIFPLGAQPNRNLYYCNEGYGQVRYRSDRFGFRNPDSNWDRDGNAVLLIGDSFAQGACVDFEDSIAGNLERKGLPTINLATGGNHPLHYASLAKSFRDVTTFRYLVVVFYPNDRGGFSTVSKEYYIDRDTPYVEKGDSGRWIINPDLLHLFEEAEVILELGTEAAESGLWQRVGGVVYRHIGLPAIRKVVRLLLPYKLSPQSMLAVDVAASVCATSGCEPVFVYIPNSPFWRPDSVALEYAKALGAYASARGVYLDASNSLRELGQLAYAKKGPHLSPEGYGRVAELIASHIVLPEKPSQSEMLRD